MRDPVKVRSSPLIERFSGLDLNFESSSGLFMQSIKNEGHYQLLPRIQILRSLT